VETKDILGFMLLFAAALAGITVTSISRRARDVAFFVVIAGAVVAERLDINFLSRYWYRGSTRGVEISFVDVIAVSVFLSSFLFPPRGSSRWRWPAGPGFMLLFLLYAFGVTIAGEPRLFGFFEYTKMLRGLIVFLAAATFVRSERELRLLIVALGCAACLQGALAFKQRFLDGLDRVAGTLDHPNSLSMYLCLIAPVLVAAINSSLPRFIRWFSAVALASAALSIVLTVSRAGVPIFAFVVLAATLFCMTWRITIGKIATVLAVSIGLAVVGVKFWDDLHQRYAKSSLSDDLNERVIDSRGYYLRLTRLIVEERFFGVGLNNWSYAVSKTYGERMNTPYADYDDIPPDFNEDENLEMNFAAPAHNLCALTVGELGVPGLALFLLMWLRWFQMGASFLWKRNRTTIQILGIGLFFGTLGVFLQSTTEWVFRQTPIYLTFHALIGILASLYVARRKTVPRPAVKAVADAAEYELAEAPAR
jgi:hypothetical protein